MLWHDAAQAINTRKEIISIGAARFMTDPAEPQ
jgi:hypothetical protein